MLPLLRLLLLSGLLSGCAAPPPVRLGFLAALTGRHASLGLAARNGATLAVEECNARGGVQGRPVMLVSRDDRQDAAAAVRAVRELVREGVGVVVGPMTSSVAQAILPVSEPAGILLVSPTVSTNELSGRDDRFLRVYPPSRQVARRLAEDARLRLGLTSIGALFDAENAAHCEGWLGHFQARFRELGGTSLRTLSFRSSQSPDYAELAKRLLARKVEGVFLLAGAMDTAMLCQHLRLRGYRGPILVSEWSTTDELLLNGGRAVEGLSFFQTFDRLNQTRIFREFRSSYRQRFSLEPTFASVHAYEATKLVLEGLSAGSPDALKRTLLARAHFQGLQGEITLDRFGDPSRPLFRMTVRDGAFRRVD